MVGVYYKQLYMAVNLILPPLFVLDVYRIQVFQVSALQPVHGLLISKCYVVDGKTKEKEFEGEIYIHETDWTWRGLAAMAPIFAVAYMHVRNTYNYVFAAALEAPFAEGFFAHLRLYSAYFVLGVYVLRKK